MIAVILAALVAIPAWWLGSPVFIVVRGTEAPPSGFSTVIANGTFVSGDPGHHNSGSAIVLTDGALYVVRFEDFSVTNGPDIHVFLAKGPRVTTGDVDLGSVRVTEGSSNYEIPARVDPRDFAYVVIWCVPFSVQFGFAALTFR